MLRTTTGLAIRHRLPQVVTFALMLGPLAALGRAQDPNVNLAPQLALPTLPTPADAKLPSLFLVGDSTVRNGKGDGANGQWGWGEPLVTFFDATKINVVNRALGGRSSRTYRTQGLWDQALALMKPGDFVLIQFGHNDSGPVNDNSRARGTLRGVGDESVEIDNLITKQHEVVHSYGWYLRRYLIEARAKGVTLIVCSLVPRKIWQDGRVVRAADDYAGWAAEVARAEGVGFIDLNEIVARRYEELGAEHVERLFADEHTHTTAEGAAINAAAVVSGLKGLRECALCPYFSIKAADVAPSAATARSWAIPHPEEHRTRRD